MTAHTILLVEDNDTTRKLFRVTLQSEGYEVLEAADGASALAHMAARRPDLVLTDVLFPDMRGTELARALRALPGGEDVPIVAISGFLSGEKEGAATTAGFTSFLVKPVEPARLLEAVRTYLPLEGGVHEPIGGGRTVLLADDDPVQLKLVRLILANAGYRVVTAADGREALRVARRERPDAILSDVLMPGLDGFDLCLAVRRDPDLAHIPVVLITSHYLEEEDRRLARRAGANEFLCRPTGYDRAPESIARSIEIGAPPLPGEDASALKAAHVHRLSEQLERQLAANAGISRRCSLQAAQLALMQGLCHSLAVRSDFESALGDILASCLDSAGISRGAVSIRSGRAAGIFHAVGLRGTDAARLEALLSAEGMPAEVAGATSHVAIPDERTPPAWGRALLDLLGVERALLVPLDAGGERIGFLVLASSTTDLRADDARQFAELLAGHISQAILFVRMISRLTLSEARYRGIVEATREGIWTFDEAGRTTFVNARMAAMLDLPLEQVQGMRVVDLLSEDDRAAAEHWLARNEAGASEAREFRIRRPDGSELFVLVSANPVLDEAGRYRGGLAVVSDLTEHKRIQAQLMMSDRMVSVGTLAAGVVHEINNPLTVAVGNLDLVWRTLSTRAAEGGLDPSLAEVLPELSDAREATQRIRQIVRDLRIFSRAEEKSGPVDVLAVLDSSSRMAWNEIRHRARLVKDYGRIPLVEASEGRLGQVFLNLIVNAAQAMKEGAADRNVLRLRTWEDQGAAVVEIRDSGCGIPVENLVKLFTPFFTTKPAGIGTGLGLSICARIVSELGGHIDVESQVGVGTAFRIRLPAARTASPPAGAGEPAALPPLTRGRVLVVDDETAVGRITGRALAKDHDVVVLESAEEALGRFRAGERFDAILCDLQMPRMTGMELHEALRALDPEQAAGMIFVTGGAFTPMARQFLDEVPNLRLDKPFDPVALRALIRDRVRSVRAGSPTP